MFFSLELYFLLSSYIFDKDGTVVGESKYMFEKFMEVLYFSSDKQLDKIKEIRIRCHI